MPKKFKLNKMLKKEIYQKLKSYNIIVPWRTKKDVMRLMLKDHEIKTKTPIDVPVQDLIDYYICSIECGVYGMLKEDDYKFPKKPPNYMVEESEWVNFLINNKAKYYVKDWEDAQVGEDLVNFTYVKHGDEETSTLSKNLIAECKRIKHKNNAAVDRILADFKRDYIPIVWSVKHGLARFLHRHTHVDNRHAASLSVRTPEPDPSWSNPDFDPYTHRYREGVLARFSLKYIEVEIRPIRDVKGDNVRFKLVKSNSLLEYEEDELDTVEDIRKLTQSYLEDKGAEIDKFMELERTLYFCHAFIKTHRTDGNNQPLYTEVGPDKVRCEVSVTYAISYRFSLQNFIHGYDQGITMSRCDEHFKIRNLKESVLMGHTSSLS